MKKRILSVIAVLALAAVLAVAMVACIPSDPDKAVENLEAEDYFTIPFSIPIGDAEDVVVAANADGDAICIVYFADSDTAKEFFESDSMTDIRESIFDEDDDVQLKRQGSIVYIGTQAAIKAAR